MMIDICINLKFDFLKEFVYRVLCAELQKSCEFLLVETNIYLHTQRARQNFKRSVVLNFCCN